MLPKKHSFRLHEAYYQKLKRQADFRLGHLSPTLAKYFREYEKDFRGAAKITNKNKLLRLIPKARLILCGDYHSLAAAQRAVQSLLKATLPAFKKRGTELVLGIEWLDARGAIYANRYLAGAMSEGDFLKKTGFAAWGFSWRNYEALFQFAKEEGLHIVGLSKGRGKTLHDRDRDAAQVLAGLLERSPNLTVVALIGDLHLAKAHLPLQFQKECARRKCRLSHIVVHQNHDATYLRTLRRKDPVELVQLQKNVFCLLNTAPWVKLSHHLQWLAVADQEVENLALSELAREHEAIEETDHTEDVGELVSLIAEFLGLPLAQRAFDDFEVKGPASLEFLDGPQAFERYSPRQREILKASLSLFEGQYLYRSSTFFLTSLSLDQMAAQAGHYLHHRLSSFEGVFEVPDRDFYPFVWAEALAFLASRIVNPNCEPTPTSSQAQLLAKAHLKGERLRNRSALWPAGHLPTSEVLCWYQVAKILGQRLGAGILKLLEKKQVSLFEVRSLFSSRFENDAASQYLAWSRRIA